MSHEDCLRRYTPEEAVEVILKGDIWTRCYSCQGSGLVDAKPSMQFVGRSLNMAGSGLEQPLSIARLTLSSPGPEQAHSRVEPSVLTSLPHPDTGEPIPVIELDSLPGSEPTVVGPSPLIGTTVPMTLPTVPTFVQSSLHPSFQPSFFSSPSSAYTKWELGPVEHVGKMPIRVDKPIQAICDTCQGEGCIVRERYRHACQVLGREVPTKPSRGLGTNLNDDQLPKTEWQFVESIHKP